MSVGSSKECARILEFKQFLQNVLHAANLAAETVEQRGCLTRASNETYPLSLSELKAEIIMTLWLHLQQKKCPVYFQFALMRAVAATVQRECFSAKECDLAYTTRYSVMLDEAEQQQQQENFDLIKLQKFVINHLERHLTRLNDNMQASNLKNYALPGALCAAEQCNCDLNDQETDLPFVAAAIKNKPRKMEDRHVCLERYAEMYELSQNYSFYAVLDGHSGPLAASYAATQLPHLLAERLLQLKHKKLTSDDYREAFETAFLQADQMFIKKRISSGTTAVCTLIAKAAAIQNECMRDHLYVAWVGDSKALLVGPKASLQLVKAHKPDALEERQRIESGDDGGTVMFVQGHWRVNGVLNVSRSIGDYSVRAAIAEPDFVDVELHAAHDYLVLGTDGLFDHVAEATIVNTVYAALCNTELNLEHIPKQLIDMAKAADSQDNITVVLVLLKSRAQIVANYKRE